jgi:transcriptional regulator with XRE-family HTH domain
VSAQPHPLAAARFSRGLTQADLAEFAGVARETISRIENGALPTFGTAVAIARALRVDVTDFLPPIDPLAATGLPDDADPDSIATFVAGDAG